jgi:hypothetical protein
MSVEANLFGGLHADTAKALEAGAGGELRGAIPKMSALHSSSALAVNLFQHWVAQKNFEMIAQLLGIPSRGISSVSFEYCCPICPDPDSRGFPSPPHLDLGIEYRHRGRVGVECKLFEPYGRLDHSTLRKPYLDLVEAWDDIPSWRRLAEQLQRGNAGFQRLGASQLVKHVLGLKYQTAAASVRLVYLYLDAIGAEAAEHRKEVLEFQGRVADDPILFVPLTVQEFIARASRVCGVQHRDYVHYLAGRYL